MPCTPIAVRASRTSSSLKGLMMAMTIFMGTTPAMAPLLRRRLWARFVQRCRARCGQGRRHESSPVPDRCPGAKRLESKTLSRDARGSLRPFVPASLRTDQPCTIFNRGSRGNRVPIPWAALNSSSDRPSERVDVGLAGPDAHRLIDRGDEDLAVADLPGLGGGDDRLHDLLDAIGRHRHLDADLRQEVHGVFGAAVDFGVALLA